VPTELPIACSLDATQLSERLGEMSALGDAALVDARTKPLHAELRFAAGGGVRERVEAIITAESQCCSFLSMGVSEAPDLVLLTVDAPAGAELVLAELVAAFRDRPAALHSAAHRRPSADRS
jgi:hypothetical protein